MWGVLGKVVEDFPGVSEEVESEFQHDIDSFVREKDGQHCPFNAFCGEKMNALKECATRR